MVLHFEIQLPAFPYGFHLITDYILDAVPPLPKSGYFHVFIRHTSAGICINEAYDPLVLHDFKLFFEHLIPHNLPGIKHTMEGIDDMPAHVKSSLIGHHLSIPILDHRLNLGTWQGIYLGEFRYRASGRNLVISIIS